jgi:hypothetical protein
MNKKSLLDSKLYITEAAESELNKADPADNNIEKLIAKHGITNQCDGGVRHPND